MDIELIKNRGLADRYERLGKLTGRMCGRDVDEKFQGQHFTRMIIAKAVAHMETMKGNIIPAYAIAQQRWGKNPMIAQILKADVAGGSSISGAWGAELVQANTRYTGDFIEYLYSRTIFDKLPLRPIPANVMVKGQDGAATGYWVGQEAAIPVTKDHFSTVTLTPLKVAALAPVSNELLRDSTPAAEMLVRDALVEASSQKVDSTFLSTSAAVSGVSPAGILNGVTPGATTGADLAAVLADIKTLYRPFITAKNASNLYHVLHPSQAKAISLLLNSLGLDAFPDLSATGGMLKKDPVVTGENVDAGYWILIKPSEIYRIGDTGITVEMSREASIEMSDAPTAEGHTPTGTSNKVVNMFQNDMTAIKVVRSINFAKRRSSAVSCLRPIDYDGTQS